MGKHLVFMPECHSTNTLALELCQQSNAPEGTLVITNNQTAGRGQRGNSWESQQSMNLTFSVVIKPTFLAVQDQFMLSMVTSLAMYDYLNAMCQVPSFIKWPNDILANGRKICGILIETQMMGEQFTSAVIGIGFNVNQQHFAVSTATSLGLIMGNVFDLQSVLEELLSRLESRYLLLREGRAKEIKEDYLKHLYRLNEEHIFRCGDQQFTGRILGVDDQGLLRVMTGDEDKRFGMKEIAFVS
jgi:BirA family transcriptional regulator, biotin operon repressor / biotin---[acetyl-CoA-carboxylase] ligase